MADCTQQDNFFLAVFQRVTKKMQKKAYFFYFAGIYLYITDRKA